MRMKHEMRYGLILVAALASFVGCPMTASDMGMPPGGQSAPEGAAFSLVGDNAVRTSGNVGIGTDAPTERLEVGGNAKVNGTIFAGAFSSNSPLELQTDGQTRVFIDDTTGKVGIGTESPARMLHVKGDAQLENFILLDTYGVLDPEISGRHTIGTAEAPMPVDDGHRLLRLTGRGWNGGSFPTGAGIFFTATQLWSGTGNGGQIEFFTTANGTTSPVERMRITESGRVGIGVTSPTFRLQLPNVADDAVGRARAHAWTTYSSRRYKRDIRRIENALDKVEQIEGVTFTWKPEHGGTRDAGLIAENVAKVMPEVVSFDAEGLPSGLDYGRVVPLLVEAVRDLRGNQDRALAARDREIAALREENTAQGDRIDRLERRLRKLERGLEQP